MCTVQDNLNTYCRTSIPLLESQGHEPKGFHLARHINLPALVLLAGCHERFLLPILYTQLYSTTLCFRTLKTGCPCKTLQMT